MMNKLFKALLFYNAIFFAFSMMMYLITDYSFEMVVSRGVVSIASVLASNAIKVERWK